MPFQLSDDVTPGARLPSTVAQYKTRLNKIAIAGFDDTAKLLKKPSDVISAINEMHTYEDKKVEKSKRLMMLTAVMYALSSTDNTNAKKLQYKKAFDKNKTTYTSPDELRAKVDATYKTKKELLG